MLYTLLFSLLPLFYMVLYIKRRYYSFFAVFFITLFIQPIFQKYGDPSMYGATFDLISFARVKTNLVIIFSILFLLILLKIKQVKSKGKVLNNYFILFIFLSIINLLLSINIQRSFYLTIISIIGPYLFFLLIINIPKRYFLDTNKITLNVIYSVFVFFLLGFVFYYYTLTRSMANIMHVTYIRGAGGIWMSNISTQILALFFPLIFIKKIRGDHPYIFGFLIFLFFIFIVVSLSRTSTVVYIFVSILMIFRDKKHSVLKKIIWISLIFSFIYLFSNIILPKYNIDIGQLYKSRFEKFGSVAQTTMSDERLKLNKIALFEFFNHPLLGVGIGNFIEINKPGYSNSHNIFTNILVERGVFIFILFLVFIFYFFKLNKKDVVLVAGNYDLIEFLRALKFGFIGFLLIGLTTNDLFVSSGFVNAWPSYIIIFFVVIQLKIYANYCN